MIDKKKLAIILSVVGACTIALIVAIIWAVTTLAGNDNGEAAPSSNPTTAAPSAEPTPTATDDAGEEEPDAGPTTDVPMLPEELQTKAENAAGAAAVWSGAASRKSHENRYKGAGFSDELAASYESVFATVYDDPAVGRYDDDEQSIRAETFASVISSEVRDIRGEEGDRLFVVAVQIHYDAQWTDRDGRVHMGGVQSQSQGEAIWGATISEKTGEIVEIEDPPATSLTAPQID